MNHGKKITTESFYNGELKQTKYTFELPVITDKANLPRELFDALTPLTNGETSSLELSIKRDGDTYRLTKKWSIRP